MDSSDGEDLKHFPQEDEDKDKKDTCVKKFLRFCFSFFGLFILLALYTVGGAYYFYSKERSLEEQRYEEMLGKAEYIDAALNYTADHLTYISHHKYGSINNCTHLTNEPFYVDKQGLYFRACQNRKDLEMQASGFCQCLWSFEDKFQAESLAHIKQLIHLIIKSSREQNYAIDLETKEPIWEWQWTFTNALLFTMTTLTVIGYGHIAPSTETLKIHVMVYTIIGLPLMMMFLANIGNLMLDGSLWIYSRICCRWCRVRRMMSEADGDEHKGKVRDEKAGKEDYMPTYELLLPITIVVLLMGSYIVLGAAVYAQWEPTWSLLDSSYFAFVTLTTIGFGDFVPGTLAAHAKESSTSLILKLIFTTFYCLLGLALIAMGIGVMQTHLTAKAQWIVQGIDSDKEAYRYILTKYPNAMITPGYKKSGQRVRRFKSVKNRNDDDEVKLTDFE